MNEEEQPIGVFTDGDLRRTFAKGIHTNSAKIIDVMHANPNTIHVNQMAIEAVETMEQKKINGLLVVDEDRKSTRLNSSHQ